MPRRGSKKQPPVELSRGEKLILVMLSEIYKTLNAIQKHEEFKPDIDAEFVNSTISSGNCWGLRRRYADIFRNEETDPQIVKETEDIMTMWRTLERSYSSLDSSDKKRVDKERGREDVKFPGFDTGEEEHLDVARYLVKHFDNYSEFRVRELNSHASLLNTYRQMLHVFKQMGCPNELSADQISTVLKLFPQLPGSE